MKEEKSVWEQLETCGLPIVLYGMGDGADKILRELENRGIGVAEVFASDEFVRGQLFHGHRVKTLGQVEEEHPQFQVVVAFATQRPQVLAQIGEIARRHPTVAPEVPVCGEAIFNRDFAVRHKEALEEVYELLADEESRRVMEGLVRYKITGKLGILREIESVKDECFTGVLCLNHQEDYLDLGAYRGDTIQEFLAQTQGEYSSITALEPNPKTFEKLRQFAGELPRTTLLPLGCWREKALLPLVGDKGRGSGLAAKGARLVPVDTVDNLMKGARVSYLKMDVEGGEKEGLEGAAATLARWKPKLNIALYHRSEDLFVLPLLIRRLNPGYRFYLRHHPYIPAWDTNLYCF